MLPGTNYKSYPVRSSAVLTTSYVAGTVLEEIHNYNQLVLLVDFTIGSLTSVELKVEYSYDGTTYVQDSNSAVSGGTTTVTSNEYTKTTTGGFIVKLPILYRYARVSVKGTGTVTSSLCAVTALLGNV